MSGKGDNRRPTEVDEQTFSHNWHRIFGKDADPVERQRIGEKIARDAFARQEAEYQKAMVDLLKHGTGVCKITSDGIEHVPLEQVNAVFRADMRDSKTCDEGAEPSTAATYDASWDRAFPGHTVLVTDDAIYINADTGE